MNLRTKHIAFIVLLLTGIVYSDEMARVRVGKRFVDDLFNIFIPQAIEQINSQQSIDFDFDKNYLFHLNIRNLTHSQVVYNKTQYTVTFNSGSSSIDINIPNFKIRVNSTIYHKLLFFGNTTGTLDADLNINFMVSLAISADRSGNLKLSLNTYNFDYRGSQINYKGSIFAFFVEKILYTFESISEFFLRQIIKSTINGVISSINDNLQNQITIPKTNSTIQIKQDKITLNDTHIDLSTKFIFTHKNLALRASLQSLEDNDDTEDLRVLFNHELVNSFGKAFFLANVFNIQLTSQNIPEQIPFRLNTQYFEHIIPDINDRYPNKELSINIKITQQPLFQFNKASQSIEFQTTALFTFALVENPKSILSFNSSLYMNVTLGANYTDSSVHLLVNKISIDKMQLISSEFPKLDIELLRSNLNFTFEIVCNAANKLYLINGIPISFVKGLKFKKVVVGVEDNFLSLTLQPDMNTTDFRWVKLN